MRGRECLGPGSAAAGARLCGSWTATGKALASASGDQTLSLGRPPPCFLRGDHNGGLLKRGLPMRHVKAWQGLRVVIVKGITTMTSGTPINEPATGPFRLLGQGHVKLE